jgi:hypothetical protein
MVVWLDQKVQKGQDILYNTHVYEPKNVVLSGQNA